MPRSSKHDLVDASPSGAHVACLGKVITKGRDEDLLDCLLVDSVEYGRDLVLQVGEGNVRFDVEYAMSGCRLTRAWFHCLDGIPISSRVTLKLLGE
jgi:hypothetical protein